MASFGPKVYDFDAIEPVTMTIIASLRLSDINLAAIFSLLPVTNLVLPPGMHFQKKQGKIKIPPSLNRPGEIVSMRWSGHVRGIVRSDKAKSFPHSIIIDVGITDQIVSLKLSRSIKFTTKSIAYAKEAHAIIAKMLVRCQEDLDLVRNNPELSQQLWEEFITSMTTPIIEEMDENGSIISEPNPLGSEIIEEDELVNRIREFYRNKTNGMTLDEMDQFYNFIITFKGNLYTGSLEMYDITSQMVNIHFHLGYPINSVAMAEVMNSHPFLAKYNNAKSSLPVRIEYKYIKYDRGNNKQVTGNHTIDVNRSGHCRHSGPNLESMKAVYYAFIQRTILYQQQIHSASKQIYEIRVKGPSQSMTIQDFKDMIEAERSLRDRILSEDVPIAKGESLSTVLEIIPEAKSSHPAEPIIEIISSDQSYLNETSIIIEIVEDTFGYSPVLSTLHGEPSISESGLEVLPLTDHSESKLIGSQDKDKFKDKDKMKDKITTKGLVKESKAFPSFDFGYNSLLSTCQ